MGHKRNKQATVSAQKWFGFYGADFFQVLYLATPFKSTVGNMCEISGTLDAQTIWFLRSALIL